MLTILDDNSSVGNLVLSVVRRGPWQRSVALVVRGRLWRGSLGEWDSTSLDASLEVNGAELGGPQYQVYHHKGDSFVASSPTFLTLQLGYPSKRNPGLGGRS